MTDSNIPEYTYKDMISDQEVRWCPGCDDYVILRAVQKALPDIGVRKENIVFISGIGCSSRFPYYMNTYGMHSIHGRAPAIATGVKLANPELSVWVITGDGDALAIGGNHFIHALRRNINLTYLLFNNEIYGLTKGQFSPTSLIGQKTKSSPYGNIHPPFSPGELALGASARFFARAAGNVPKAMTKTFIEAEKFHGTALVEILQNCVIFNDGCFDQYVTKENRQDGQLILSHGERMIFGKEGNKGIRLNGLKLEAVIIGEDGVTEEDILIHDAHEQDSTMHMMLVKLKMPLAIGVIRSVYEISFEERAAEQMAEVKKNSKFDCVNDLLLSGQTWDVD